MNPPAPSALPAWPRFRAAVLADPTLHARLLAAPDAEAFRATALALAAEHGIPFAPAELEAAIMDARRAWLTRRVTP